MENANPTAPLSYECSVCYDDKPSADFDLSGNCLKTLCECYARDSEKRLCLDCVRTLRRGENKCPFCRRLNFLSNTRLNVVPSCFDFEHRYVRISNEAYEALTEADKSVYRRRYIESCYEFNASLFDHINRTPEAEMPNAHRLYMEIYREAVQRITQYDSADLSYDPINWFITEDDANILRARMTNFRPSGVENLLCDTLYIHIRDTNATDGYRRYSFTTYAPEDVVSHAEEYIENNILYMSRSFIYDFIPEGTTRRAMRINNDALWEQMQGDECFRELLLSLVDLPEMTDCIVSGVSPCNIELHEIFGIAEDEYIESGYIQILGVEYTYMLYEF